MIRRRQRSGFFLVLVLVVIAIATLSVYSFTELMVAHDDAAHLAGDLVQARVNVESASESIRLLLSQSPDAREDAGGVFSNPMQFQARVVAVGDEGDAPSNFTVIAPNLDENGRYAGIRFGLQDESARLNINTLVVLEENSSMLTGALALTSGDASLLGGDLSSALGSESGESDSESEVDTENLAVSLLMALPGMSADTADAILDWLDEDDEPRPLGCESDYYLTLPTPYAAANGPLHTVEELLLVRGVSPTLLFGIDTNRNGVVDADEQMRSGASVDTSGALGWAAYLTVHSAEANKRSDGTPTIKVNQDDMQLLYDELMASGGDEMFLSFIVAYRIAGVAATTAAIAGGDSSGGQSAGGENGNKKPPLEWTPDVLAQLDLTGGGGTTINQVLDLVDAQVTIGQGDEAQLFNSPFKSDPVSMALYMPLLMDAVTTQDAAIIPGRINLNECAAELLYGIPLLSEEVVDGILEARQNSSDDPNRKYETWPLVEGLVTLTEMKSLLPLLTGGGDVYRAQIVGYYEDRAASHRSEVIFDATSVNPKVIAWRDLSHLGRGFDLSVLGQRSVAAISN